MAINDVLVTVIIPIYNAEKYVSKLIENLRLQTFSNAEYIIVNDGSTDQTDDVVTSRLETLSDSRFRYVKKENEGVSVARNFGIQIAEGEYIIFVDGDDEFSNDFIEYYYDAIVKSQADIEFFNFSVLYPQKNIQIQNYATNLKTGYRSFNQVLKDIFNYKVQGFPFAYISKRKLWVSGFPENIRISEDLYALVKILKTNSDALAHYTAESRYTYVLSENSALRSDPNADFEGIQTTREISKLFDKGTTEWKKSKNLTIGLYFSFLRNAISQHDISLIEAYRKDIIKEFFKTRMPILSRIKRTIILILSFLVSK